MLASSQAYISAATDESASFSTEYSAQYDNVSLYNGDNNGLWASSEASSSPEFLPSPVYWVTPIKHEPEEVKQESSPSDGVSMKTEGVSDSDIIADDEWNQASMEPFFGRVQMGGQMLASPSSLQLQQTSFPEGPVCTTSYDTPALCLPPAQSGGVVLCPATDEQNKVKLERTVSSSPPRQNKSCKKAKLSQSVAGSSPLPPDLELPAILGGKLPPRDFKASGKRKHVFTERELRRRRKRGLPDDSDSESEERRLVRLPRRSLLTITTAQMSNFVTFMRSTVNLTPSQQDELSRQKRLVKNRECACRFRAKKELTLIEYRERLTELEDDVITLRAENEQLRRALKEATARGQQQQQQPVPSSV